MSGIAQRDLDQIFWEEMIKVLITIPFSATEPEPWAQDIGRCADALLVERNKRFPYQNPAQVMEDFGRRIRGEKRP